MGQLRVSDLELEAVSPLWIGGASSQAELRAPSLRGCLRYWFRALAGAFFGQQLPLLRAAESAVFGDTKRASSVVVRLTGTVRTSTTLTPGTEPLPGLAYLFWSVMQQGRDAILPGEKCRLRLQTRPHPFPPLEVAGRTLSMADCYELAQASLWVALRLGGVGARARRAGGGMAAVTQPADWPTSLPSLIGAATTPAEYARELSLGLAQVRQVARWPVQPVGAPSAWDILHPSVCQLVVLDRAFPTWWEALAWTGEQFQVFRRAVGEDSSAMGGLLATGRLFVQTIQRAIFGLPLLFSFKGMLADLLGKGIDAKEARRRSSVTVAPSKGQGRGSPMFFRLVRLAGAPPSYTVLMGLFRSRFLPDLEMTVRPNERGSRQHRVATPATFALVERWFEYARGQAGGLQTVPLA
jgi:CRISPR-associated protein Cmr1